MNRYIYIYNSYVLLDQRFVLFTACQSFFPPKIINKLDPALFYQWVTYLRNDNIGFLNLISLCTSLKQTQPRPSSFITLKSWERAKNAPPAKQWPEEEEENQ